MRLSYAWIADHLTGSQHIPSHEELVTLLVRHVAEVDDAQRVAIARGALYAAAIVEQTEASVSVHIPELGEQYTLPVRDVTFADAWHLVYVEQHEARWATLADVGGHTDALFPAVNLVDAAARDGSWRKQIPESTYMIEVDNAGITHRPDLWGHRGFAREVDTICQYQSGSTMLRPYEQLMADVPVVQAGQSRASYRPQIMTKGCNRFVTYYISDVTAQPSDLSIALRLAWVGVKPHNVLVDLTNYIMYDLGQPMHAFDADALPEQAITVRDAHAGEQVQALDGSACELAEDDMVVASGDTPLSVAGVIGGDESGISYRTRNIVLEAAHFDPTRIRKTSARIKRRTESSMRFEKDADPYATDMAIRRYLYMLEQADVTCTSAKEASAVGDLPNLPRIRVSHQMIANRIGHTQSDLYITNIMTLLGCHVSEENASDTSLCIDVPSHRRTDVMRAEDIVEEVARVIGYDTIAYELPYYPMYPRTLQASQRVQTVKQHCAYALAMREIVTYGFFDERWIHKLGYEPQQAASIANPVSEYTYRLVTSLIPHMLHAVARNAHAYATSRFFEWGNVWHTDGKQVYEDEVLTGVFFEKDAVQTIYDVRSHLYTLFRLLQMEVAWQPIEDDAYRPWWADPAAVARLMCNRNGVWYELGYAGRVADAIMEQAASGQAFVFELSGEILRTYNAAEPAFYGIPKYQSTWFDVSLRIAQNVSVADLEARARQADSHIYDVYLVDLYEKEVEGYARSATLRVTAGAREKTLSRDEIEAIRERVRTVLQEFHIQFR